MKRPLLLVALLYLGGVLMAEFAPWSCPPFVLAGAGLSVGALCLFAGRFRPGLLAALLVLAGAANLALRTRVVAPDDLRHLLGGDAQLMSLRGALRETPYHRVYQHDSEATWRTLAEIQVRSIRRRGGDWEPATGRIVASTPGILPENFFGGCVVEVEGVLAKPQPPAVPGQFDYRTYLERRDIHFQLRVSATNDWQLAREFAQPARPPLSDRFSNWAMATLGRGLPEDESLRLLWTMTLGWKTALTGEVSEPFMRSGTMHIFAISGLHIALIAGLLVLVLRAAKVPSTLCGALVIPLIWAYTGVTGWQASAIRSTIMMSVIIAGWSLRRPSDLLNSLAGAAFLILLWDPQQLFQAGFQLSFCVVLSLALFTPVLDGVRQRLLAEDPLLPAQLRPRWQRLLRTGAGWVLAGLVTSLAAWLGSIPLIASYFNLFTPASLLANLLVVPLSGVALASNVASLAVGGMLPATAEWFNHTAWLAMWLMIRISQWAAQLPGGCFHIGTPGILGFALYYALLVAAMAGWLLKPRIRVWTAAGLALLFLAWLVPKLASPPSTRLTVLPLGGAAICVDAPGTKNDLLIDCGNRNSAEFVLKPFLRSQGLNRFAGLVLTHGDVNHVGGGGFILDQFRVHETLSGPIEFRSASYRELQKRLQLTHGSVRTLEREAALGPWRVLHPEKTDRFSQADDGALVLHAQLGGARVLLLSDLGKPGQNALLSRYPDLRADIVVSGIPMQGEPLAEGLLDVLRPQAILVADSLYPAAARASHRLRERLETRGLPVFYTSERGALTVVLRGKDWRIVTATGLVLVASHQSQ
jgi:ComEC/Rec2-related protein